MIRLVFRPYAQFKRSICTSESRRTSIRVSPDFVLTRYSSSSLGSQRVRSWCASTSKISNERDETSVSPLAAPAEREAVRDAPRLRPVGRVALAARNLTDYFLDACLCFAGRDLWGTRPRRGIVSPETRETCASPAPFAFTLPAGL